ncbi:MAG: hypothetical protein QXM54_04300 [Desulfurococcaceae archaeon]|uniref:Uncharacterized protein n=1 Tax=Staphylothermus marinus TaxID=2280 RepID=A0A7C4DAN6_STAMA
MKIIQLRRTLNHVVKEEINRFFGNGFESTLNEKTEELYDAVANALLHRVLNARGKCRDGDSIKYDCIQDAYNLLQALQLNLIVDVDISIVDEERVWRILKKYL